MNCTTEGCERTAMVEIKSLDPEDSSGGRFCLPHGRYFLGGDPRAGITVADLDQQIESLMSDRNILQGRLGRLDDYDLKVASGQLVTMEAAAIFGAAQARKPKKPPLKMALTVNQTVQPRQYESADVTIRLVDLTLETTEDEINAMMERSTIIIAEMAKRVGAKSKETRNAHDFA